MREFQLQMKKGVIYLSIPSFENNDIINGFSSRITKGVETNKLLEALNLNGKLYALKQVHGKKVIVIDNEDDINGQEKAEGDGLVTGRKGIVLSMYSADCPVLFLFDPVKRVVGLGHAGWRGTVKGIGLELVKAMNNFYQCREENILAGISPAIGSCCYEVGEEVIQGTARILDNDFSCCEEKTGGKWMLDLKEVNSRVLEKAGIQKNNIAVSKLCTFCNSSLFYSYRRSGGSTGRMMSVISLGD